jgi:hypothetical protein
VSDADAPDHAFAQSAADESRRLELFEAHLDPTTKARLERLGVGHSFDLIHDRALLMHLPDDPNLLPRMVSWLAPGGWLLLEEADFGLWLQDLDPPWALHPHTAHAAFPHLSLSRGRSLLKQIPDTGLVDIGADGHVDIVHGGSPLAEFYQLSFAAIGPRAVRAGALTPEQARAVAEKVTRPDFLGCGFVYIGIWGRRA